MKIGIFADVHNNAVALEAALRALEDEGCEVLACAGDIIGIGPWPEETVQRLMRIPNLIAVRGNHERYLLEGMPAKCPNDEGMDEAEMAYHRWEHSRLSAASVAFLRALPDRADLEAHGRRIAVMHYGMDSDRRFGPFTPHPDEDDLCRLFPDAQDASGRAGRRPVRARPRALDPPVREDVVRQLRRAGLSRRAAERRPRGRAGHRAGWAHGRAKHRHPL